MKLSIAVSVSALLFMSMAPPSYAREPSSEYVQGMLGRLASDEIWTLEDPATGEPLTSDLDNLIYGGGGVQMNFSDNALEYGYEGGGLISFSNDTNVFAASNGNGGTLAFNIDNNFLLLDLFMGGFVGLKVGEHLRIYGAAGPAILLGSLDRGDQEVVTPVGAQQAVVISGKGRTSRATAGLYGRIGLDLLLDNGFTVGASVRQVDAVLDFDESGEMDFNHPQFFINIGKVYSGM